jgi:hypothetical protein
VKYWYNWQMLNVIIGVTIVLNIVMLSVNFFCNISSYDILAYITKNYIALIYYAKIVHLLYMPVSREEGWVFSYITCTGSWYIYY